MERMKSLLLVVSLMFSLMAGAQDIAKRYAFEGKLNGKVAGTDSYGCFGMGASFDGVYVKVKN